MCLYNKLIKNPKYKENKKNGGRVPPVIDPRALYVPIGCGECIECRKQKAREWQVRLQEEVRYNNNGAKFITLTISNEEYYNIVENNTIKELQNIKNLQGYQRDNEIATKTLRLFLERWRKEFKKSLKHWMVTELGHNGTENIHMHGIVWTEQTFNDIRRIWKYGFIWPKPQEEQRNYVSMTTVNYITKYVHKIDEDHKHYKSRILTSPGIGAGYLNSPNAKNNKFNEEKTDETYRTSTGHKIAIPIYYRNKLYTDEQKEKLWLHKLNKQERWICGEKIDMRNEKEGNIEYLNTLKFYRNKNRSLGYGRGLINIQQKEYEKQRREIQNLTRISKGKEKAILKKYGYKGVLIDGEHWNISDLPQAPF